ncbi:MAG: pyridine nucleotide-disulfide oxidoreductase [SAR86 cluster bacterium]|uniref:Pyridine nucleotide-disulfide oxidoreductase n=1 Tax=SAR86 cluster bacterium TaxID=2030880 RepID=A0A2A5CGF1_9GAMM|nr:FAD-dependent oxidoreductase [Gammaproteobacteria bacterium AH-315-E17]PCJ42585.1 MAG: pyridine nucleotide-disulfide oxidoreductase [SAR86 cluster bacterium]
MNKQRCIIVGASHAAGELCASLRKEGWTGSITVVGDEAYLPYNRPPLSKTFLAGEKSIDDLLIRHEQAYVKADIEMKLGCRVEKIDREQKEITLNNDEILSYDKLILTTGARPRTMDMPGADAENVFYLRSIYDADRIRPYIKKGRRAVIIGGGYIGLETAAMLVSTGMQVTLLEREPRILNRVAAPEISQFFTRIHTEEGVELITDVEISQLKGDKQINEVVCSDGRSFEADLVIIGIGVITNSELAEEVGLEINNGIVVNAFAETNDPDILAAGDCTYHFNKHYQRWLRLESIQNAVEQAKVAARTICGTRQEYDQIPWFWSDQYDLKLQIAGLSTGYDNLIVRGDLSEGRKISFFYFKENTLLAVDAVNSPQEFMFGKRALAQSLRLDREKLVDSSISMKAILLQA